MLDTASIITGGVGYNIGLPLVLSTDSLDSMSNLLISLSDTTTYSPLGPHSIYELVASNDGKRKNKLAVLVNKKTTRIPLGPPTVQDIPQIRLLTSEKADGNVLASYQEQMSGLYECFLANRNLTHSNLEGEEPAELTSVPKGFFSNSFRLDDPKIFYDVLQDRKILRDDGTPDPSFAGSLPDELSTHLDTVEAHLVSEIGRSSGSFFHTFHDLGRITKAARDCSQHAEEIRNELTSINSLVTPAEHILSLTIKRANALKLQKVMLQASLASEIASRAVEYGAQRAADALAYADLADAVITGDLDAFEHALERMQSHVPSAKNLHEELARLRALFGIEFDDLTAVPALSATSNLLNELRKRIGEVTKNLFIDLLAQELHLAVGLGLVQQALAGLLAENVRYDNRILAQNLVLFLNTSRSSNQSDFSESLKNEAVKYLFGLARSGNLFNFFKALQERLIVEFKNIIRTYLPLEPRTDGMSESSFGVALDTESNSYVPLAHIKDGHGSKKNQLLETASSALGTTSNVSANQTLVSNLRALGNAAEFEVIIVNVYAHLVLAFQKVSKLQKLLLDLLLDLVQFLRTEGKPLENSENSLDDSSLAALDLSGTISKLADIVNKRLYKIVNVRADQILNCLMTGYDFYSRFYVITRALLISIENIAPAASSPNFLSRFLTKETYDYYISYTTILKKNTIDIIEADTWKDLTSLQNPETLRAEGQRLIDELVGVSFGDEGKVTLPSSWLEIGLSTYLKGVPLVGDGKVLNTPETASDRLLVSSDEKSPLINSDLTVSKIGKRETKKLRVKPLHEARDVEEELIVPQLVLSVLQSLKELLILHLTLGKQHLLFPFVIVDLLRLTNTKMRHQILGANATKTTDLKHITAKHLTVLAQALQVFMWLIPYISAFVSAVNRVNLNKKVFKRVNEVQNSTAGDITVEEEFENVTQAFKDHQNDVFTKLVTIMTDRVQNHASDLKKVNFSEPVGQCHKYMEVLVKETLTILRVLTKNLLKGHYLAILLEIFDGYKKTFLNEFSKFGENFFKDNFEKMNLLRDIDYFRVKLGDLPGYGECGTVMWEYVNGIRTKEDAEMELKMGWNRNSFETSNRSSFEVKSDRSHGEQPEKTEKQENQSKPEKVDAAVKKPFLQADSIKAHNDSSHSVLLEGEDSMVDSTSMDVDETTDTSIKENIKVNEDGRTLGQLKENENILDSLKPLPVVRVDEAEPSELFSRSQSPESESGNSKTDTPSSSTESTNMEVEKLMESKELLETLKPDEMKNKASDSGVTTSDGGSDGNSEKSLNEEAVALEGLEKPSAVESPLKGTDTAEAKEDEASDDVATEESLTANTDELKPSVLSQTEARTEVPTNTEQTEKNSNTATQAPNLSEEQFKETENVCEEEEDVPNTVSDATPETTNSPPSQTEAKPTTKKKNQKKKKAQKRKKRS